jgi:hypothetical protein
VGPTKGHQSPPTPPPLPRPARPARRLLKDNAALGNVATTAAAQQAATLAQQRQRHEEEAEGAHCWSPAAACADGAKRSRTPSVADSLNSMDGSADERHSAGQPAGPAAAARLPAPRAAVSVEQPDPSRPDVLRVRVARGAGGQGHAVRAARVCDALRALPACVTSASVADPSCGAPAADVFELVLEDGSLGPDDVLCAASCALRSAARMAAGAGAGAACASPTGSTGQYHHHPSAALAASQQGGSGAAQHPRVHALEAQAAQHPLLSGGSASRCASMQSMQSMQSMHSMQPMQPMQPQHHAGQLLMQAHAQQQQQHHHHHLAPELMPLHAHDALHGGFCGAEDAALALLLCDDDGSDGPAGFYGAPSKRLRQDVF